MKYCVTERPAFEMFGVAGLIDLRENAFEAVPAFCRRCDEDGSVDEMNALLGRFHDSYLHAALYDFTDEGFQYMICYYLPKDFPLPPQFTTLSVPAHTWAVFTMPDAGCTMEEFRRRIWSEWFPPHPATSRYTGRNLKCTMDRPDTETPCVKYGCRCRKNNGTAGFFAV